MSRRRTKSGQQLGGCKPKLYVDCAVELVESVWDSTLVQQKEKLKTGNAFAFILITVFTDTARLFFF
jgi:hypothetical protein